MSKGREAQCVKCPFFIRFTYSGIVCEGFTEGGVCETRFAKSLDRSQYIDRFCNAYKKNGERCPQAKMLEDYYDRLDNNEDVRFVYSNDVRCEIKLDRATQYGFVFGIIKRIFLPDVKNYGALCSAESNGDTAYKIRLICDDGYNDVVCVVRRGFIPKNEGGVVGVVYWIIEKYNAMDLYIFDSKAKKKSAKKKKSPGSKKSTDVVITPASFGDEIFGEILDEYLSKKISLSELARTHGISYKTIYYRSKKENWAEFRSNYRKIVIKKTLNRLSNIDALKLKRLMDGCDRLNELINECLKDDEQPYLYVDDFGNEVKRKKINTKYLMEMSLLLDKQTKVTSALYGILTENEAQKLDIERSRLEGNIAKLNNQRGDERDAGGVIMLPPVLEGSDDANTIIESEG